MIVGYRLRVSLFLSLPNGVALSMDDKNNDKMNLVLVYYYISMFSFLHF